MQYTFEQTVAIMCLVFAVVMLALASGGEVNLNVDVGDFGVTYGTTTHYLYSTYGSVVDSYLLYNGHGWDTVHVYFIPGYGMYHVIVSSGIVVGWPR